MGFGKNLAKGFVRSAVNQVGRDGGKVISNQLYGNAHSVPHRSVNGNEQPEFIGMEAKEIRTERCDGDSNTKIVVFILLAFMFNFIGGLILFFIGLKRWFARETVDGWRFYSAPVFVLDRRYKDGMRYDGEQVQRKRVTLVADELELANNKNIAKTYMIAGAAIILFYIIVLNIIK